VLSETVCPLNQRRHTETFLYIVTYQRWSFYLSSWKCENSMASRRCERRVLSCWFRQDF
jgi:hypothetical protein